MDLQIELADPKLTRERVFALFAKAVKWRFAPKEIDFSEPDELRIVSNDGTTHRVFLENLWRICLDEGVEQRVAAFERLLRTLNLEGKSYFGKQDIVPIIKDSEYLSSFGDGSSILHSHLAGDIWIVYAVDLPDSTKTLSHSELAALRIPIETLYTVALENLRALLPEIERHGEGPFYMLTAGGDYVASILLLEEVWSELEEIVEGDAVVAVPSRDVLLFTGSRSKEGIEKVRLKAREIHEGGDHVISQTLLRRVSGTWKVFE